MSYLLTLQLKNKKTRNPETISSIEYEDTDYGFYFTVANELDAYKAAYQYRDSGKTEIEYLIPSGTWMIRVISK